MVFHTLHFVVDHDVTMGSSASKSRTIGTAEADLAAGHAQILCCICKAIKQRRDCANFCPLAA